MVILSLKLQGQECWGKKHFVKKFVKIVFEESINHIGCIKNNEYYTDI